MMPVPDLPCSLGCRELRVARERLLARLLCAHLERPCFRLHSRQVRLRQGFQKLERRCQAFGLLEVSFGRLEVLVVRNDFWTTPCRVVASAFGVCLDEAVCSGGAGRSCLHLQYRRPSLPLKCCRCSMEEHFNWQVFRAICTSRLWKILYEIPHAQASKLSGECARI